LHADTGKLGSGWNDAQISEALETYPVMFIRVLRTYATQGLDAVLNRKERATPPTPDFDTIPFLMMNGDYRSVVFRERNCAAVAAMNASPTRKVAPRSWRVPNTRFEGKFNGHTHMGMLGSTALAQFDVFLDWAEKNIPNPIVKTSCTKRTARGP
jgi:hypothetical protein